MADTRPCAQDLRKTAAQIHALKMIGQQQEGTGENNTAASRATNSYATATSLPPPFNQSLHTLPGQCLVICGIYKVAARESHHISGLLTHCQTLSCVMQYAYDIQCAQTHATEQGKARNRNKGQGPHF